MQKTAIATMLAALYLTQPLYAMENNIVYGAQNNPVFQVRFFEPGDGPFMSGETEQSQPLTSTWSLDQQQKDKILQALRYWAQVITPQPGALPAIINVGTFDEENAVGNSEPVAKDGSLINMLAMALQGEKPGELTFGSHGQFALGKLDFDNENYLPAQIPRTGNADLNSVALHELAHGLGIGGLISDQNGEGTPGFDADFPLTQWDAHLRDDNGNPAHPGQIVLCDDCDNSPDAQGFDVRKDKGYFAGEHVKEVLAGALPGVPVRMLSDDGTLDDNYMSHSELKNSLMSHQDYRNYTTFMEAELAILQDLGYHIDRRNFFGFSVYGDGQTLVNRHGYFQRNAQGDAYLPGQYNTALLGMGLHVYGSNNRISQQADLLTKGDGGAGIRVDGQNNTLIIEPGTRIYADGLNGRGIIFAYGKDHNLIQRGDIQANGDYGIALNFDFGNNLLGDEKEYRGSWIHYVEGYYDDVLPELSGALVNNVDISGRVIGKGAAIYISQNALVNQINLLRGATLAGNIYSDYAEQAEDGQQRLTQLTFGRLADDQGRTTEQADPAFRLGYRGNITGINNLALQLEGGVTSLNGSHEIYSLAIAPGATLAGNGDYTLNAQGSFVNNGLLTPGNSLGKVTINGDYQQGESGELQLEFNARGGHDTLTVNGDAELAGKLSFVPQRDWYASDWQLDSQALFNAASYSGEFSEVAGLLDSPTLTLAAQPVEAGRWQLTMRRAADAYSRYGSDGNAQQVGRALDRIVTAAGSDIQPLYRALDFSSPDGKEIDSTLHQLSPAAYSASFAGSLYRERQIVQRINAPFAAQAPQDDGWHGFAHPFGGGFQQQRAGSRLGYQLSSYGTVAGAEKRSERYRDWLWGFHGAVGHQSVTVNAPENGRGTTTSFDLGVQARYNAGAQKGSYLFGNGRIGVEESDMTRRIGTDDFNVSHRARWTGWSGALTAGGGYRFALNDRLMFGPIASLSYTRFYRPDVTESGSDASRLRLDASSFDSLRSSLGAGASWQQPLAAGGAVSTTLQLSWDRELLSGTATQNAHFASYNKAAFSSKNQPAMRDTLGIKAGVNWQVNPKLTLGAGVDSELRGAGYHAVSGNLSAAWRF